MISNQMFFHMNVYCLNIPKLSHLENTMDTQIIYYTKTSYPNEATMATPDIEENS